MEAKEERRTVDHQLVSLAAEPVHRPLLRADLDEVIADELEDILTGACCVRGDVAELSDRFPHGLNVRHVLRVDHSPSRVDGQRGGRGGRHTSMRTVVREVRGLPH